MTHLNHPRSLVRMVLVALAFLVAGIAFAAPDAGEKRVALVIGNSTYKNSPLKNPVNDARDMAVRLKALGFEVIERSNLRTRQMGAALREFRSKLSPGAVALVFYAGHGVQIKGENYLPSVDAEIESEEDIPSQSISMKQVMDVLEESKTRLNLVFLDACRNNPYARSFRSGSDGLARVSAPSGTLISYATRPGSVAADGSGKNGLYTGHLLKQMEQSQAPVEQVLKRVVTGVKNESAGRQEPWMEGSIEGDFCFGQCSASGLLASASRTAAEIEDEQWDLIKASRDPSVFENYLRQYPRGRYVAQSRVRLASLRETPGQDASARQAEAAFWRSVESSGARADIDAYLSQYPQGQFVDVARARIVAIEETSAKKRQEQEAADRAARAAAPAPRINPDLFVTDRVRADMAKLRTLVPNSPGGTSVKIQLAVAPQGNRIEATISKSGDICVLAYNTKNILFYHSGGLLVAGGTGTMLYSDQRAATVEQSYEGDIAALRPGQTLVARLKSSGQPGETLITVEDTRESWPEYGYARPATRLKVVRDFETHGGYLKVEEVVLYSPEVGCAIPVAQDFTSINGNKMFGSKSVSKLSGRVLEVSAK